MPTLDTAADQRTAWRLTAVAFVALAALGHHTWGTIDAIQRMALTRSILTSGSIITPDFGPIKYGPLHSVIMLPTYALGYALGLVSGSSDPHRTGYRVTAFVLTPILLSTLLGIWYILARRLGYSIRASGVGAWTLFWCSLLLPYSRLLFSEILTAILFLGAALCFFPDGRAPRPAGFFLLGAATLNYLVFAPLLSFAVLAIPVREWQLGRNATARRLALFGVLSVGATVVSWAAYNYARYDSVLKFGYDGETFSTPVLRGLYGLLASPGRGLLYYSLPSAFAVMLIGARVIRGRDWRDSVVLGTFFFYLLLYAHWGSFEGGWCWGPRFLLPFLPLLHLAFLPLLGNTPRVASASLATLFSFGFLVNVWEYSSEWHAFEKATFGDGTVDYMRGVFEWRLAPALHGFVGANTVERALQFLGIAVATSLIARVVVRKAEVADISARPTA